MDEKILELENERLKKVLSENNGILETFRAFNEFWDNYLLRVLERGEKGTLSIDFGKCTADDVRKLLESDAIVTYCRYAARERVDFPKIYNALFYYRCSDEARENAKKVCNIMRDVIIEEKVHKKKNKHVAQIHDDLIDCYLRSANYFGVEIEDRTWDAIKEFYDELPEDTHFFNTKFYEKYWLENKDRDEKIYNIFPIKSKEEYEARLAEFTFDRNGMVNDPIKYDHTLGEYLTFYGKEVPEEDKERYLHIMFKNAHKGEFYTTQTAKYFNNSSSGKRILDRNPLLVINDILKNYRMSYYTIDCLNNDVYRKVYLHMKMYYKDYISSLAENGKDAVEFVKRLIEANGAHYFTRRYNVSPDFENINDIVDMEKFLRGTYLFDALAKNFDDYKLNDPTVYEDGLTNFDYADMALGLIVKRNIYNGVREVLSEETRELYARNGRDVRDSRAMREVVKSFINTAREYSSQYKEKDIMNACVEFVKYVSRKPDFNLYTDKECSDIIQIAKNKDNDFARYLENEITIGMMENPEYTNLSLDEAYDYAWRFMDYVGDRPMGKELEYEFEDFLRALSVIRINDEKGVVPQEFNEFIIKQSLAKDSFINSNAEKYESILERAAENLFLNRGNSDGALYFVENVDDIRGYYPGRDNINIIDRKRLIHNLLADPMFSKEYENANVPQYVEQYVDLDAIEAGILGKMDAEKAELMMEKEERDSREDR